MKIINAQSLAATVDAINLATFTPEPIPRSQRLEATPWIAERQGKPGSYANMFAPTKRDFDRGIRLFTGEKSPPTPGSVTFSGKRPAEP